MNCGHNCGSNSLIGRGDREQYFDYWFDYDVASQCAIAFDYQKQMWIAQRFFSDETNDLPFTQGLANTAAMLKYEVEFGDDGQLIITDVIESQSSFSPNPCLE